MIGGHKKLVLAHLTYFACFTPIDIYQTTLNVSPHIASWNSTNFDRWTISVGQIVPEIALYMGPTLVSFCLFWRGFDKSVWLPIIRNPKPTRQKEVEIIPNFKKCLKSKKVSKKWFNNYCPRGRPLIIWGLVKKEKKKIVQTLRRKKFT